VATPAHRIPGLALRPGHAADFNTGALNHPATLPRFEISKLFCSHDENKTAFATALLPFWFTPLHGVLKSGVHQCCGLGLHPWQDVTVKVERDANLTVAEALARDLGVHARG
jgi:hypothetical protein